MIHRADTTRGTRGQRVRHQRVLICEREASRHRRPFALVRVAIVLAALLFPRGEANAQTLLAMPVVADTVATADSAALLSVAALEDHMTRVIDNVLPSLVAVIGEWPRATAGVLGAAERTRPTRVSVASGFVVSGGYIVTTQAVARNAKTFRVKPYKQPERAARLVAIDPISRLCILRTADTTGLLPARIAEGNSLRLGSWVFVVGTTGLTDVNTTFGTVSRVPDPAEDPNLHYLATNAAVSPGASGAPVLDSRGEVVGVALASLVAPSDGGTLGSAEGSPGNVTHHLVGTGTSLAVPLDVLQGVVEMLRDRGTVTRGYLGVQWNPDIGTGPALATTLPQGAHLWDVQAGGPADDAHLRKGDVVTYCNGTLVRNGPALQSMIQRAAPGSIARLTVLREEQTFTVTVHLGSLPSSISESEPGHVPSDTPASPDDRPSR